jgi:phosphoglycolate phosphatase
MNIRAVVFDLDGTLIDTAPDLAHATNYVLARCGRRAVGLEEVRLMVGHGARALITRGFAVTGAPVEASELDRLYSEFIAYYQANIAIDSQLFPGSVELLVRCRLAGLKLGVCTNKPESLSRKLIEAMGVDFYFGSVVGSDTLGIFKPDARPYRETLRQLGVNGGASIFVGDSETDVLTARAAGVPVIGVTFGYADKPIAELEPDYLAHHFSEVWPLIEQRVAA